MHPPYSFSQRGTSLAIGSLTSWVGVGLSERKIKAIPFIVRFPLFLLGESRAHRMDSEHGALLLSRITTGNVFPCDVTVNNFSAKGNKSVDFGTVCTLSSRCLFTEICTYFTHSELIYTQTLQMSSVCVEPRWLLAKPHIWLKMTFDLKWTHQQSYYTDADLWVILRSNTVSGSPNSESSHGSATVTRHGCSVLRTRGDVVKEILESFFLAFPKPKPQECEDRGKQWVHLCQP